MKKLILSTLALALFLSFDKQGTGPIQIFPIAGLTKSVLTIGNSYSRASGMLLKLEQMAFSTGDTVLIDSSLLYAGARMVSHAKSDRVINKIKVKSWDFISLQTHSQEAAFSQEHIDTAVFPSVSKLVVKIQDNNSTPLYYRTWAYQNVNTTLCDSLPNFCSYETMDSLNHARVLYFAQELHGEVAPVGVVWKFLRAQHPEICLYSSDDSHANALGAYTNACVFYTMIFKKSPKFIRYHYNLSDTSQEELVLQVVHNLVYEHLSDWQY